MRLSVPPALSKSIAALLLLPTPILHANEVQWTKCEFSAKYPEVADRLECGSLTVPLDHHDPAAATKTISVVRVRAEEAALREGVIFFNPGGPGGDPSRLVPNISASWFLNQPEEGPTQEARKRLSQRFDLVGMVPRGVGASGNLTCTSDAVYPAHHDVTEDRSEANIRLIETAAQRVAESCLRQPHVATLNTEQTARDMDALRIALGEQKIHYFGGSYGTWLGAWYGALFPQHVDRMLLDSNMNWLGTFDETFLAQAPARQSAFHHQVSVPASREPERYGLGDDPEAITNSFAELLPKVRSGSRPLESAVHLMVARFADSQLRTFPNLSKEQLLQRLENHVYSQDADLNRSARDLALQFSESIFFTPRERPISYPNQYSMYLTVRCNDTASNRDPRFWRQVGDTYATQCPIEGSDVSINPCVYWTKPTSTVPPIPAELPHVGSLLMVQAEFDHVTPLQGAMTAFEGIPTASMLIARNNDAHFLFTRDVSPCIEQAASRFLAYGEKPASRLSYCQPETITRTAASVDADSRASEVLRELRKGLDDINGPSSR